MCSGNEGRQENSEKPVEKDTVECPCPLSNLHILNVDSSLPRERREILALGKGRKVKVIQL